VCECECTRSTLRYGIDAPPVVAAMAVGGFAALALIVAGGPALPLLIASASCLATVALMLHSSLRGKLHERDRMLDGLELKGAERLLDLGCGRGLLVLGAAHRLPRGRVTGIDR
jgi:hypothetical protein